MVYALQYKVLLNMMAYLCRLVRKYIYKDLPLEFGAFCLRHQDILPNVRTSFCHL